MVGSCRDVDIVLLQFSDANVCLANTHREFRCCCFTRRSLKTSSAFLVLPRVHSQVYVFVRASTRDGLIKEPDQAQGFRKNAERSVMVSILRQLIVRAVRV